MDQKSQKKSKAKSKESGDGKAALPMEVFPSYIFILRLDYLILYSNSMLYIYTTFNRDFEITLKNFFGYIYCLNIHES